MTGHVSIDAPSSPTRDRSAERLLGSPGLVLIFCAFQPAVAPRGLERPSAQVVPALFPDDRQKCGSRLELQPVIVVAHDPRFVGSVASTTMPRYVFPSGAPAAKAAPKASAGAVTTAPIRISCTGGGASFLGTGFLAFVVVFFFFFFGFLGFGGGAPPRRHRPISLRPWVPSRRRRKAGPAVHALLVSVDPAPRAVSSKSASGMARISAGMTVSRGSTSPDGALWSVLGKGTLSQASAIDGAPSGGRPSSAGVPIGEVGLARRGQARPARLAADDAQRRARRPRRRRDAAPARLAARGRRRVAHVVVKNAEEGLVHHGLGSSGLERCGSPARGSLLRRALILKIAPSRSRGPFAGRSLSPTLWRCDGSSKAGGASQGAARRWLRLAPPPRLHASVFLIPSVLQDASWRAARALLNSCRLRGGLLVFAIPHFIAAAPSLQAAPRLSTSLQHCVHPRRASTPSLRFKTMGKFLEAPLRPHAPHPASARAQRPAK